jgi:glycosyltransferase involved in cell wall biosynthesis
MTRSSRRLLLWAGERLRSRLSRRGRRIGWVTAHTLEPGLRFEALGGLGGAMDMRISRMARGVAALDPGLHCEIYVPGRPYHAVVFVKAMGPRCLAEARDLQGRGVRVVFDANVNYYEVWGEYEVPGTRPTEAQQRDAIAITAMADAVVADSTALGEVAAKHNPRIWVVTDNVDLADFPRPRVHRPTAPLRLVWSGVAGKAAPLLSIRDVLARVLGLELLLVSDAEPPALAALRGALPCRYLPWSERSYPRLLAECDAIVSPKRLVNGYEIGHTEYKIALGMAAGLPALASPQRSYVEAIEHAGGGILADSPEQWEAGLRRLADPATRAELGARARRTVEQRYATPVVAARYLEVLRGVLEAR